MAFDGSLESNAQLRSRNSIRQWDEMRKGVPEVEALQQAQAANPFVWIKRNSTARSGCRYAGNLISDAGTSGALVQFIIANDSGEEDLIATNKEVLAMPCPSRHESHSDWGVVGTYGEKYYVVSICPYSGAK